MHLSWLGPQLMVCLSMLWLPSCLPATNPSAPRKVLRSTKNVALGPRGHSPRSLPQSYYSLLFITPVSLVRTFFISDFFHLTWRSEDSSRWVLLLFTTFLTKGVKFTHFTITVWFSRVGMSYLTSHPDVCLVYTGACVSLS